MTEQQKHTPGPWKVEESGFVTGSPKTNVVTERGTKICSVIGEANARLIADAPELLEAAKIGLEVVKEMIKDAGPCEHDVNICVCGYISYANQIEAAITKAEGR